MKFVVLLPLLILLSSCSIYFEPEFNLSNETRVFQVVDGDTFIISGGDYVRLLGIDAPEKGEEGYHEATDFLRNLSEGKVVVLISEGANRDRYGRLLRHVFINDTNVALELLENNLAAIYENYNETYGGEFSKAVKSLR